MAEDDLLRGFEPVRVTSRTIHTFGKAYSWNSSYLPSVTDGSGQSVVLESNFVRRSIAGDEALVPDRIEIIEACVDHAVMFAQGRLNDYVRLTVVSRVDYDSVVTVTATLSAPGSAVVDAFDFRARIPRTEATVILGYRARSIRPQKRRDDIMRPSYEGEFVNVLSFSDGARSFWWFADNARGWIWNGPNVTELVDRKTSVELRQRIVGAPTIGAPLTFEFGLLATPVSDAVSDPPRLRIVRWSDRSEKSPSWQNLRLWWPTAFAYDAFPYTRYPKDTAARLSERDKAAYPGLAANRRLVIKARQEHSVELLPYSSLHALSMLDPALVQHRRAWEVEPPMIYEDGLAPYSNDYAKPVLTHRAEGFSDHLVERLSVELKNLGATGVYLDHGPPKDSINELNGAWTDSNGIPQPSLDIFATREFLRRLRGAIEAQSPQRLAHVVVHASNREIIPAYTFASALVSGEQYRGVVSDGDYLSHVSIDEFRARLAPDQYGIPLIFLPTEWARYTGDPAWQGGRQQTTSYLRTTGLILLHNLIEWPVGPQPAEWDEVQTFLRCFHIAGARFEGYWSQNVAKSESAAILISVYRHGNDKWLVVAFNTSPRPQRTVIRVDFENEPPTWVALNGKTGRLLAEGLSAELDGRSFEAWILSRPGLQVGPECSSHSPQ